MAAQADPADPADQADQATQADPVDLIDPAQPEALVFGLLPTTPEKIREVLLGDDPAIDAQKRDWAAGKLVEMMASEDERWSPRAERAFVELIADSAPASARLSLIRALADSAWQGRPSVGQALYDLRGSLKSELEADWARVLGRFEIEAIAEAVQAQALDKEAELEKRRLAIRVLSEHRQRYAARTLIALSESDDDPLIRDDAFDGLARLSHQALAPRETLYWKQWLDQVDAMSTSQWRHYLHRNLLVASTRQARMDAEIRDRLLRSQRALYRATAEAQRPALLAQMLGDALVSVRSSAMDLARQRAEDGGEFDESLRAELRERLADENPRLREDSATLLGQLLDAPAADAIAKRLERGDETSQSVQRAYLVALTAMPREQALAPAAERLRDPSLQDTAAGMLAAAYRAQLGDRAFWDSVQAAVQESLDGVSKPKAQLVTLLGLVVNKDNDLVWSRIDNWLGAEDDLVRVAAARTWSESGRPLVVLARRIDDPVIRPIALKAVIDRGDDPQTLAAVIQRRPTEAEDLRLWDQALVAIASRVSSDALLNAIDQLASIQVIENLPTRQLREQMLSAAIDAIDPDQPPSAQRAALLLRRAQTRDADTAPALIVLDYRAALESLDLLTAAQIDRARRGLTLALLADDGRIEQALAVAAEVLEPEGTLIPNAADDPLVRALIAAIRANIDQGRKDDATQLLTGLRALLAGQVSADTDAQLIKLQEQIDQEQAPPPVAPADPPPAPAPAA